MYVIFWIIKFNSFLDQVSTVLSKISWSRAATSPAETAQGANLSMEISLKMRTLPCHTPLACSQWRTLVQTRMVHSFSFALRQHRGWMENMSSLEKVYNFIIQLYSFLVQSGFDVVKKMEGVETGSARGRDNPRQEVTIAKSSCRSPASEYYLDTKNL